jgi:hypothetical protein
MNVLDKGKNGKRSSAGATATGFEGSSTPSSGFHPSSKCSEVPVLHYLLLFDRHLLPPPLPSSQINYFHFVYALYLFIFLQKPMNQPLELSRQQRSVYENI